MSDEYIKEDVIRQSFDLPTDLHKKLGYYLPYGTKRHFFIKITEIAIQGIERGGYEVIGAILQGDYLPLLKSMQEIEDGSE